MQISCGGIYLGNGGSGLEAETRTYWALNPSLTPTQILAINAHILAIKYGSGVVISGLTVDISNATGYLFLTNPSVDLRWLKGFYLNLNDGAGKNLKVLVDNQGTGETTGATLNTSTCINGGYTTFDGASASGFHVIWGSGTQYASTADEIAYVNGGLFKQVFIVGSNTGALPTVSNRSGVGGGIIGVNAPAIAGVNTRYTTLLSTTTGVLQFTNTGTAEYTVSGLDIAQVLTPSLLGAYFSSPTVDSGFNYNAASFTATATRN